jgi:hypothetical protein
VFSALINCIHEISRAAHALRISTSLPTHLSFTSRQPVQRASFVSHHPSTGRCCSSIAGSDKLFRPRGGQVTPTDIPVFTPLHPNMSYYNQGYQPSGAAGSSAQNLQFYSSSYDAVSGHTTPSQASYGGYGGSGANAASAYPSYGGGARPGGGGADFGGAGVSGRMGEQGGLRTGWVAAFGTEGYDGEPGLLEELGVNFGHIKTKVSWVLNITHSIADSSSSDSSSP